MLSNCRGCNSTLSAVAIAPGPAQDKGAPDSSERALDVEFNLVGS